MSDAYNQLLVHLEDVVHLSRIGGLLEWDQETLMPPGGAEARGKQAATVARLGHELFTSDKTGTLLEKAASEIDDDPDSDAVRMLRVARADYDRALKLPSEHVAEFARITSVSQPIWAAARESNDYARFAPHLRTILDMVRQQADYVGYDDNPYDASIADFEPGLTAAAIQATFDAHRPALVELVQAIQGAEQVDDGVLHGDFPPDAQLAFTLDIVKQLGFDFERGRQDVAEHPFEMFISPSDVRLTTRFDPTWLNPTVFSLIHEAGHGMYDQGVAPHLDSTFLGDVKSVSLHESQSRLWENLVGRSRGFWQWALPKLKDHFPHLVGVGADEFYRAVNKVTPSFIRVEADEVTYNLHVMLRFEIESDLINGRLLVDDLPAAWNDRFQAMFGLVPPTDTVGVLQDVHWSVGLFGYFPTYALGNLLSVQFWNSAVAAHPAIPDQIAQGNFVTLHGWLTENIYRHGRKFDMAEMVQRAAGQPMTADPYMAYLKSKFGAIYDL